MATEGDTVLFALNNQAGRKVVSGLLIKHLGSISGTQCSAILCPVIPDVGGQMVRVNNISGAPVSVMTMAVPTAHLRPSTSQVPSPFTLALTDSFNHSSLLPLVENLENFQSPCSESAPEFESLSVDQTRLQLAQQADQIKNLTKLVSQLMPKHTSQAASSSVSVTAMPSSQTRTSLADFSHLESLWRDADDEDAEEEDEEESRRARRVRGVTSPGLMAGPTRPMSQGMSNMQANTSVPSMQPQHELPPDSKPDVNSLINFQILKMLEKMQKREDSDDSDSEKKDVTGFKGVFKIRKQVQNQPNKVYRLFKEDIAAQLGVSNPTQVWCFRDYAKKQLPRFGKMKGLWRTYYHLAHLLDTFESGQPNQVRAEIVQGMKAVLQVGVDQGDWTSGSLLMPYVDPISQSPFGGTEEEMQAVMKYRKGMKELKTKLKEKDKDDE